MQDKQPTKFLNMRYLLSLILATCLLTSTSSQGFSQKPLRLFFEKKIATEEYPPVPPDTTTEHLVQEGDWLYRILAQHGYSKAQIQTILPTIQELNPEIPDINRLRAGQVLHLPGISSQQQPKIPEPTIIHPQTQGTVTYVVQSGDTVRFVVKNLGQLPHEFSLGTQAELRAHQQQMQAMPHMQHHNEPGKLTLSPGQQGEVVWRFGQTGTVHFACLVPGHYEAGMQGRIEVIQP